MSEMDANRYTKGPRPRSGGSPRKYSPVSSTGADEIPLPPPYLSPFQLDSKHCPDGEGGLDHGA